MFLLKQKQHKKCVCVCVCACCSQKNCNNLSNLNIYSTWNSEQPVFNGWKWWNTHFSWNDLVRHPIETTNKTSWWFQLFLFSPLLPWGFMIQFDFRIFFQVGWFNRQLEDGCLERPEHLNAGHRHLNLLWHKRWGCSKKNVGKQIGWCGSFSGVPTRIIWGRLGKASITLLKLQMVHLVES